MPHSPLAVEIASHRHRYTKRKQKITMAEATRKQSCAVGEDQQNPSLSIVTPEKECQEQFPVIPYYDKKLQSLISSVTREESATSHTLPNIDENLTAHEPKKDPCFAYVDIQRNVAFRSIDGETSNKDLAIIFKEQARRRRSELVPLQFCHMIKNENENVRFVPVAPNESLPSGAQDWLPFISRKEVAYKEKQALLLQHASNLIGDAFHNDSSSFGEQLNNSPNKDASKLADLNFPKYVEPSAELFKLAHKSLEDLLPQGDCEPFHSSDVVRQYYEYWKPDSVKVSRAFLFNNLFV